MCHRNNVAFLIVILLLALSAYGKRGQLELGFANIETVAAADHPGGPQHMISGIIVRIYDSSRKREIFAMSSQLGMAFVPLRPGKYCTEALSSSGEFLQMDPEQHRCFDVHSGETITVGVVIVSNSGAH